MAKKEKKIKSFFIKMLAGMIKSGPSAPPPFESMKTILVLRPDRLGDMILSMPAYGLLRKFFKGKIVYVAGSINSGEAKLFFPGAETILYRKKNIFSVMGLLFRLLKGKFDAVIDMHSYPFSVTTGLYALFSGAKCRIGFSETEKVKNELAPKIFSAGIDLNDDNVHESVKNLMLVEKLGIQRNNKAERESLNINLPEEAKVFAFRFYDTVGINNKDTVIGIHPTLKKKDNRWSKQFYLDFLRQAKIKFEAKVVAIHGAGEEKEAGEFREMIKGEDGVYMAPFNGLVNTMAIASRFSVLVCNDSGIMHSMSLVTKIAAIFGPSDPQRWGPIGNNSRIILRSPDLKCDSVNPGSAAEAVGTLLNA